MSLKKDHLVFPNSTDLFIIEELHARLQQGHTVRIAFGGNSMLPMIDGEGDKVILRPLNPLELMQRGEIFLFSYQGHCVIHRLMRIWNGRLTFRGDNCRQTETVGIDDVWARLVAVEHADGRVESCDSEEWISRSKRVFRRRSLRNIPFRLFGRSQRRWERWCYFALLLLLMWAPVGGLGVPLDNFVLGIRLDHLLHASVYIPCCFFLMDFAAIGWSHKIRCWLTAVLMALTTETVQYLLPYRGFDINDLVANFLGVTLGWMIIRFLKRNRNRISN